MTYRGANRVNILINYKATSGKVCGLLSVLSGTWRGPNSTDRPNRPLTGSCQELECEDASWSLLAVLLGSEQVPDRTVRGLQELQGLGTRTIC